MKRLRVSEGSPQPPLRWGFSLKGRKGEGVGKQQGREEEKKVEKGGGRDGKGAGRGGRGGRWGGGRSVRLNRAL